MWNDRAFDNFDAWLESPYQEGIAAADAYYDWCEAHDLDPEAPETLEAYEDYCADEYYDDDDEDYEWEEAWDDAD